MLTVISDFSSSTDEEIALVHWIAQNISYGVQWAIIIVVLLFIVVPIIFSIIEFICEKNFAFDEIDNLKSKIKKLEDENKMYRYVAELNTSLEKKIEILTGELKLEKSKNRFFGYRNTVVNISLLALSGFSKKMISSSMGLKYLIVCNICKKYRIETDD